MTPCDAPIILDISLGESPGAVHQIMFKKVIGRLLVGVITKLVWDRNLHTVTAYSWMWSTQTGHTAFGTIGKTSPPDKKLTGTEQKWLSTIKLCQRVARGHLCRGSPFEIDTDFHQRWGKTVALVGWFHSVGGSVPVLLSSSPHIFHGVVRFLWLSRTINIPYWESCDINFELNWLPLGYDWVGHC